MTQEAKGVDTSGEVGPLPAGPYNERFLRFEDLTPFCQGYVEAALRSFPVFDWGGKEQHSTVDVIATDRPATAATFWNRTKRVQGALRNAAKAGRAALSPSPLNEKEEGR